MPRLRPWRTKLGELTRLRLGRIAYLNTEPFFGTDSVRSGSIALPPRQVYDLAVAGGVDVAPLPSVALADHPDLFSQVGNFAIAAAGPVTSVLLHTTVPPQLFGTQTVIGVTEETATSIRLLKILLHEYWGIGPRLQYDPLGPDNDAQLVIGDAALRSADERFPITVDLGAAWQELAGAPFVYGLWLSAMDSDPAQLADLADYFSVNLARNIGDVSEIAERRPGLGMSVAEIEDYLSRFSYRLGDREMAGLQKFFKLDAKQRTRTTPR